MAAEQSSNRKHDINVKLYHLLGDLFREITSSSKSPISKADLIRKAIEENLPLAHQRFGNRTRPSGAGYEPASVQLDGATKDRVHAIMDQRPKGVPRSRNAVIAEAVARWIYDHHEEFGIDADVVKDATGFGEDAKPDTSASS